MSAHRYGWLVVDAASGRPLLPVVFATSEEAADDARAQGFEPETTHLRSVVLPAA